MTDTSGIVCTIVLTRDLYSCTQKHSHTYNQLQAGGGIVVHLWLSVMFFGPC